MIIEQPADRSIEGIKNEYSRQLSWIKDYLKYQEEDINKYNQQIESLIRNTVKSRLVRLEKLEGLSKMLGIPMKHKEGVPEIKPIHMERRLITQLPPPPKSSFQPEPGIIDNDYEKPDIHERIRVSTIQMERSVEWKGEFRGIMELRKHWGNYFWGYPNFKSFRQKLMEEETMDGVKAILEEIREYYY